MQRGLRSFRRPAENGDTVTVKAKAPAGWRFEPAEKQFTVKGLTEWVLNTSQLNGDNLAAIHANTERLIREDWEDIVSSSLAQDMSYTPYRMYLFISDEEYDHCSGRQVFCFIPDL